MHLRARCNLHSAKPDEVAAICTVSKKLCATAIIKITHHAQQHPDTPTNTCMPAAPTDEQLHPGSGPASADHQGLFATSRDSCHLQHYCAAKPHGLLRCYMAARARTIPGPLHKPYSSVSAPTNINRSTHSANLHAGRLQPLRSHRSGSQQPAMMTPVPPPSPSSLTHTHTQARQHAAPGSGQQHAALRQACPTAGHTSTAAARTPHVASN
jgi:hypothetical protein